MTGKYLNYIWESQWLINRYGVCYNNSCGIATMGDVVLLVFLVTFGGIRPLSQRRIYGK